MAMLYHRGVDFDVLISYLEGGLVISTNWLNLKQGELVVV